MPVVLSPRSRHYCKSSSWITTIPTLAATAQPDSSPRSSPTLCRDERVQVMPFKWICCQINSPWATSDTGLAVTGKGKVELNSENIVSCQIKTNSEHGTYQNAKGWRFFTGWEPFILLWTWWSMRSPDLFILQFVLVPLQQRRGTTSMLCPAHKHARIFSHCSEGLCKEQIYFK